MTATQIREDLEGMLAYQNSPGHQPLTTKTVLERVLNLARAVEKLEARMDAIEGQNLDPGFGDASRSQ